MALWDKLKVELDRAGKVAQSAIDESKVRLEAFRARQLADRAAQALGYAVFHARQRNETVDDATLQRLVDALAVRDREVTTLEAKLREATRQGRDAPADTAGPARAADSSGSEPDYGENPSPS